ncbi:flagellar hook capping FlgD N-terminal domain-containing protein [Shimia sp. MMG029]|uniref:flagellar hook capping FlgD N-terminal domain-containing protein n=1 Tax=Shimia sp. MMG029 TaxID=3021978 RepID=UPI0022FF2B90|nr:flagellar hook capping FlgD N-terminal domain-containing protein [Shimia sp. MMG029]MDA5557420.1 flagellar hook capping FlgD N-terminal domain-containing protein [Shimia sp. MMG029]
MDAVTPSTTATTSRSATASQAAAANQNETALSSDFETFLKMLSVQMQNQDPLNPQDSTEFATQLAQFSTVEQQTLTNTLLTNLGTQLTTMGLSSLTNWVGMDARIAAPAHFSGTPIEVVPNTNTQADKAYLIVKDENGTEVQKFSIDPEAKTLDWVGVNDSGSKFANGVYSFETESYAKDELLDRVHADVYARVTEARTGTDGVVLVAPGGIEFGSDKVLSLRQPS